MPSVGLHILMEVRRDGLAAVTDYRVRARIPGYTLVELFPHTGRQHQLRVHLSAIGHPIVGDKLYGPEREAPFLESIETGLTPELVARLGHERHALHAHRLAFKHPLNGKAMELEAPADSRSRGPLEQARSRRSNHVRAFPALESP